MANLEQLNTTERIEKELAPISTTRPETYFNVNNARREAAKMEGFNPTAMNVRTLSRLKLAPFIFNSNKSEAREKLLMRGQPAGRSLELPAKILAAQKMNEKLTWSHLRHFALQGNYFYWYTKSKDIKARGYVQLSTARIGLNPIKPLIKNHKHYDQVLVLHPRNDGKPLYILMDEDGESWRQTFLKVLSVIDAQKLLLESHIKEGYNDFFKLVEPQTSPISKFRIRVKPLTPAVEGRFFRAFSLNPKMKELSLINMRFSSNGIARLA